MKYNSSRLLCLWLDYVLCGNLLSRFLSSYIFGNDATPPTSNVCLAPTFGRPSCHGTFAPSVQKPHGRAYFLLVAPCPRLVVIATEWLRMRIEKEGFSSRMSHFLILLNSDRAFDQD